VRNRKGGGTTEHDNTESLDKKDSEKRPSNSTRTYRKLEIEGEGITGERDHTILGVLRRAGKAEVGKKTRESLKRNEHPGLREERRT